MKVGGGREFDALARSGMDEGKFVGVEAEAGEIGAAAGGVADDRVADGFAVDAELVCAAGDGF